MQKLIILTLTQTKNIGSSPCGSAVMNLTSIHYDAGLIPGLTQWIMDLVFP